MDHLDKCLEEVDRCLLELDESSREPLGSYADSIQSNVECTDRNLYKILDQQPIVRALIEIDSRISQLRQSITKDKNTIEQLRRDTARISSDSVKDRAELLAAQAKEIEKYQMQQLKSITADHRRHTEILELRKQELIVVRREAEDEEKNRESYLEGIRTNFEKQLQARQLLRKTGGVQLSRASNATSSCGITDELFQPDHVELTSIDEYAPYGRATGTRGGKASAGGRGGLARGRKRRA